MTRNRLKTAAILTGIVCVGAAILTGCDTKSVAESTKSGAESVVEAATKCPDYDPNTMNGCLHRACITTEGRREYDTECDEMWRAERHESDEEVSRNALGYRCETGYDTTTDRRNCLKPTDANPTGK